MDGLAPASVGPATGSQFDNRRVLAALIDLALLVPMALVMSLLFGGFTDAAAALTLGWALYYYFACESDHGQTIGKRFMKIRVARADGQPLDVGRVAVRTLLRPIDAIGAYLVGVVVMLATGTRRQRLGDLAAGTVVTEADSSAAGVSEQSVAEAPEIPQAPVIEPPPVPSEPVAEPEPIVEAEPEPVVEAEPEPVVEAEPEPTVDDIVPVDREQEPEQPTDEPVPVPQEAEEGPDEEPASQSRLEIVSPIDLIMQDHDDPADPQDPPRDSA